MSHVIVQSAETAHCKLSGATESVDGFADARPSPLQRGSFGVDGGFSPRHAAARRAATRRLASPAIFLHDPSSSLPLPIDEERCPTVDTPTPRGYNLPSLAGLPAKLALTTGSRALDDGAIPGRQTTIAVGQPVRRADPDPRAVPRLGGAVFARHPHLPHDGQRQVRLLLRLPGHREWAGENTLSWHADDPRTARTAGA